MRPRIYIGGYVCPLVCPSVLSRSLFLNPSFSNLSFSFLSFNLCKMPGALLTTLSKKLSIFLQICLSFLISVHVLHYVFIFSISVSLSWSFSFFPNPSICFFFFDLSLLLSIILSICLSLLISVLIFVPIFVYLARLLPFLFS